MKKAYKYKFAGKEHSRKGKAGLILAVLSLLSGVGLVAVSFVEKGNGNIYLGSGGALALLLALLAFVLGIQGMREENKYRVYPLLSLGLGLVSLAGWVTVYVMGALYV